MTKTPICDFLETYEKENRLRLHMPGHNGEFPHDITEIDGADSLFETDESEGIIAESERITAEMFGAARTCYSCAGSTLAIQAALAVLKSRGVKTIAASRYSHRSLVSAATALRMDIKWLYPAEYLSADVKYDSEAIRGADALFVTNVDCLGGTWKFVKPNIPVLVDNAHGAYLKFVDKRKFGTEYCHPLELGFPMMIADSAHKTLPVLTGGAYLHFAGDFDSSRAKEMMALFGSTSPSYLILESLDRCNKILDDDKELVTRACETVAQLKSNLEAAGIPLKKSDPLRVVIKAYEAGLTGYEYAEVLRSHGVECEMADDDHVVLLFSAVTTVEDCENAQMAILLSPLGAPRPATQFPAIKPKAELPIYEAMWKPSKLVDIDKAAGEVCAQLKAPCPPGVLLIMPGEAITAEVVEALKAHKVSKLSVISK